MKRIAVVGGGLAGLAAAYEITQLARAGAAVELTLFEATDRLGGVVETVRKDGFTIECGPDGWVTEKPWAAELARELGLAGELISSNDATRKTWILLDGQLRALPDGMRMMVPTDLDAVDRSGLFSAAAKQAFREEPGRAAELRAAAPDADESIGSLITRHFGREVLERVAAPLLSGVFGGDVATLSARAVMGPFVAMERSHGSLITGLQAQLRDSPPRPVFTSLRSGVGILTDRLAASLPPASVRRNVTVRGIAREGSQWRLAGGDPELGRGELFDHLLLATPAHVTGGLLRPVDAQAADLIPTEASSAIAVALAFPKGGLPLPPGFGFLVPPGGPLSLLACTFADQKFPGRAPPGAQLLRAFFGAGSAERLGRQTDAGLVQLALRELRTILGPLPDPAFSVVRRWPRSLPQYAVGHADRMAELDRRLAMLPHFDLLGNAYRGVGLPDLIRDGRLAGRLAAGVGEV